MIGIEGVILDPKSFRTIADLAYRESGLTLVAEKMSMIQSRLRHRLRALGCPDFKSYAAYVCSDAGLAERKHLISALTTNVSHFFREHHHFDTLVDKVLNPRLDDLKAGNPMRIWSAGCSNGQEAYSIVMRALDAVPDLASYDFRVLATDIDAQVVRYARAGVYTQRLLNGVPVALLDRYFTEETTDAEHKYAVKEGLKKLISFRELNLHDTWPMKRRFDAIFCRNVLIYFDQATQEALWPRFGNQIASDGLLFLGHSERIAHPERHGFRLLGPTTYSRQLAA